MTYESHAFTVLAQESQKVPVRAVLEKQERLLVRPQVSNHLEDVRMRTERLHELDLAHEFVPKVGSKGREERL